MGLIPDRTIDEILGRVDIVEVIGERIPLRRAGRNFRARCPFHTEKTPSFMVSQEKQIWHCFGCGVGGNVFGFVARYENLSFPEAVRMLAEKAGIEVPGPERLSGSDAVRASLYEALDRAVRFYQERLKDAAEGEAARNYLIGRGIDDKTRDLFRLGWAPAARTHLVRWVKEQGLSPELFIRVGLAVRQPDGALCDRFHGRLMFPIADVRGRVVGFGARVLDQSLPKYINSPDTELYSKGANLYGLHLAREAARKDRTLICVEGYLDALTLYQHGIQNCVATLGTALTPEHARLIRRFADDCVLVFDADRAGEEATLRGAEVLMGDDLGLKVLSLGHVKDPDELVREEGPEKFIELARKAEDLFEFRLRLMSARYGTRDARSQWKVVSALLGTLAGISNAVIRANYIRRLSSALSLPEEAIVVELNKARRKGRTPAGEAPVHRGEGRRFIEERLLLGLMLGDEEAVATVREKLRPEDFHNPDYRALASHLFKQEDPQRLARPAALLEDVESPALAALLTSLSAESEHYTNRPQMIQDCIRRVQRNEAHQRRRDLIEEIRLAERHRDEGRVNKLLTSLKDVQVI
ncbi:MAG: DNA primase [Candidatus Omnitrophica bacterium]|nr:DNA primase [Candidatus Omnitrophota bacterium]